MRYASFCLRSRNSSASRSTTSCISRLNSVLHRMTFRVPQWISFSRKHSLLVNLHFLACLLTDFFGLCCCCCAPLQHPRTACRSGPSFACFEWIEGTQDSAPTAHHVLLNSLSCLNGLLFLPHHCCL